MDVLQRISVLALSAVCLVSCSFLHDDRVVARVGHNRLYKSQVVAIIPPGLPAQDSTALAGEYIKMWAAEIIINEMAQKQLSKQQKDVRKELEDYRSSLLKYRYEQFYVENHLDTCVSSGQIKEYYEANRKSLELSRPMLKCVYMRLPEASPIAEDADELLHSTDPYAYSSLDSLCRGAAGAVNDYGGKWIDIVALARDFGMDYGTVLSARNGSDISIVDSYGLRHTAYVKDFIATGQVPPVECCADRIRNSIVSGRKYALSSNLERELLDDALESGRFVIFQEEEQQK